MGEGIAMAVLAEWVRQFAASISAHRDELTDLDSAIGDADHGTNMDRGMQAALAAVAESAPSTPAALLSQVGMTLISTVGGASGPLYGTLFLRMGAALGAADLVSPEQLTEGLRAARDG